MGHLHFTTHAVRHMAQRGIAKEDVELIQLIGTEGEGGYLVRERDFQAIDRELRRFRGQLRRLVGKRLVFETDRVITAYHANPGKQRLLLRSAQTRSSMES